MGLQRTGEMETALVETKAVSLLGFKGSRGLMGFCPECTHWVTEIQGVGVGHKVTCAGPSLNRPVPTTGYEIPLGREALDKVLRKLVGLKVQVLRTMSGRWFIAEGDTPWGPWDLAEGMQRLGLLPPAELVEALEIIPEDQRHRIRHLWVVRGAKRSAKIIAEKAEAEAERVGRLKKVMFPASSDREGVLTEPSLELRQG